MQKHQACWLAVVCFGISALLSLRGAGFSEQHEVRMAANMSLGALACSVIGLLGLFYWLRSAVKGSLRWRNK